MPKFRKKPVVIEAHQITDVEEVPQIADWCGSFYYIDDFAAQIDIQTLEGVMAAYVGDWVIKGVAGEFYPCRDDIFRATYEPLDD